jgi:hypothetical protein
VDRHLGVCVVLATDPATATDEKGPCPGSLEVNGRAPKAPSQLVSFSERNGVVADSGQLNWFGPVVGCIDGDDIVSDPPVVDNWTLVQYASA